MDGFGVPWWETAALLAGMAGVAAALALLLPVPPASADDLTEHEHDGEAGVVSWPMLRTLLLLSVAAVLVWGREVGAATVACCTALGLLEVDGRRPATAGPSCAASMVWDDGDVLSCVREAGHDCSWHLDPDGSQWEASGEPVR